MPNQGQTVYLTRTNGTAQPLRVITSTVNGKGSGSSEQNSQRIMTLSAWTQTEPQDFNLSLQLNGYLSNEEVQKRERELTTRIQTLEENLRAHNEVLTQIHATSARTAQLMQQQQPPILTVLQSTPLQQQQTILQPLPSIQTLQPIMHQQQQHQQQAQYSFSITANSNNNNNSHSNGNLNGSLINPMQPVHHNSQTESIKYTIIAESNDAEQVEIQLAEDDGAINLDDSGNSDRLEICLDNDLTSIGKELKAEEIDVETVGEVKVKRESRSGEDTESSYPLKRRRIDERSLTPQDVNINGRQSSGGAMGKNRASNDNSGRSHKTPSVSPKGSLSSKLAMDTVMVSIGPNNTHVPAAIYDSINWKSASIATRKLLMAVFDRQTLATHSMTGKPSPAFKDHGKPLKQMLEPKIIQDIIFAVTRKCNASEKEVRTAITTKCADENKMMKLQNNKNRSLRELNKENQGK